LKLILSDTTETIFPKVAMYKPNVFKKYVLFTEFLGQGHNRNSTTTHSGGTEFETP